MRLVTLLSVLALGSGCKGDAQKCEQAARNYATLTFWAKADKEINAAPAAKRDGLRKKKLSAFTNELESKIDVVVSQCQSANNDEQIDCMIAAKTADQAMECAELVPTE
jgi:hypothetical protein